LTPDDVASLPSHIMNGEVHGDEFDTAFKKQGIRQLVYTSTQGEDFVRITPDGSAGAGSHFFPSVVPNLRLLAHELIEATHVSCGSIEQIIERVCEFRWVHR